MTVEAFWQEFLQKTGRPAGTKYLDAFHFELTEKLANELLALVLAGKKRATASALCSYALEGERLPQKGDPSIVTDWAGEPKCVIETTGVTILPFKDVTFDVCKREGEDECLETWQAGHRRFFIADGKELEYEFTEDLDVLFEDFEVVWKAE